MLAYFKDMVSALSSSHTLDSNGPQRIEKLGDVEMISQQDLQDIWEWNMTVPKSIELCVHDTIGEVARKQPQAPAVCAWDGDWTYGELDRLSTQLAHHLVTLGLRPEAVVPLCFEKSKWTPVAMLAVMKAGGASVAMDTTQPEERLRTIVSQVEPVLMLCSSQNQPLANRLVNGKPLVVLDESHFSQLEQPRDGAILPTVKPWNKLYVAFTSGSTGIPKGAMITHMNFSSAIQHQEVAHDFDTTSRVYDFVSYAFDVAWSNFLRTLACGACLCIPSEADRRDDLAGSIRRLRANVAQLTPSTASLLPLETMQALKILVVGGESLPLEEAKRWATMVTVKNAYGPCECTPPIALVDVDAKSTATIGRGVGVNTWVVRPSDHNYLVAVGNVGELLLEGPIVGTGYIGNPERTAASFIENPSWLLRGAAGKPGRHGRLYKTGDLVQYNTDGTLVFMGRKDAQVKINGQRVELTDIEHHVFSNMVDDAETSVVVEVLTPLESDKAVLVAFLHITMTDESAIKEEIQRLTSGLAERLAERIPLYMIPSAWVPVENIPMTATGKTDRRRLRAIGEGMTMKELNAFTSADGVTQRQPSTPMERRIRGLWSSVLGVEEESIGIDDSFLRIGGDSIEAMKLVAMAREQGLSLTVTDIFKCPRLRDLAMAVSESSGAEKLIVEPFSLLEAGTNVQDVCDQAASLCGVDPKQIEDVFPCTPLQEGLLALTSKRSGDYVARRVLELQATVDVGRFCRAWEKVAKATPILRTRIVNISDYGLMQVVIDEEISWNDKLSSAKTYVHRDREVVMGLGAPLVRFGIIHHDEGDGKSYFVWTTHHATYDGWSMPLLIKMFERAYEEEINMENSAPSFTAFVKHINDIDTQDATSFWKRYFDGLEGQIYPELPAPNHQPKANESIAVHIHDLNWPKIDVTPSTAVRAAWSLVAASCADSDDVIFGVLLTGRQAALPGVDQIIGPTITTVPVRIAVDRQKTVEELQLQIQSQAMEMTAFEQTGMQKIRQVSVESQRACTFQTLLVIQPAMAEGTRWGELFVDTAETKDNNEDGKDGLSRFHTYALTVRCNLEEDGLRLWLGFDSNIIESQDIRKIARQFEYAIRLICDPGSANKRLNDIELVHQQDLDDIWGWNAIVPKTSHKCVHDLIQEKVDIQPDAPAVCAWDGNWTYGELEDASTRLACHLVSLGVGSEDIVPLVFEKSRWMPIAALAVMKAGAASVAIDITQPEQRLRTIMQQIKPLVILSSAKSQNIASVAISGSSANAEGIVILDESHSTQLKGKPEQVQLPIVRPTDRLYIAFTSGSTGKPKGAIITHSNFSSAIKYQQTARGFDSTSRVYDFASYAFDVSWSNMLHALTCGGCLCIPSESDRRNDLAGSIRRLGANFASLTPSTASILPESTLKSLQKLVLGGESLSLEATKRWAGMNTLIVRNGYGPCECTPTATIEVLDVSTTRASIGRPFGMNAWLTRPSDHNYLVSVGEVGELLLEGPLVGSGYLQDPITTAAAFIENPQWLLRGTTSQPGRQGRLYKTGDLVRYNSDGSLVFVGRKDSQVKIRGQRVELGDVEHHIQMSIMNSNGINAQVVAEVVTPMESDTGILIAFVQTNEATKTGENAHELRAETMKKILTGLNERLAAEVPNYMIPVAYMPMESIPVTPTGKVDRRMLRRIGESMTLEQLNELNAPRSEKRQPISAMEVKLQSLWSDVLRISPERIGADDSFLRSGGDSIAAMKLVSMARDQGLSLTVADIFQQPRLTDMAKLAVELLEKTEVATIAPFSLLKDGIDNVTALNQIAALVGVNASQVEDAFPCTPLQEGLVALTAKRSGNYIARQVFELQPAVEVDRLREAWEEVVKTSPILRTRIVDLVGQGLVQVVIDETAQWESTFTCLEKTTQDSEVIMGYGTPLVRVGMATTEDQGSRKRFLVLIMHHAIYDGWSMPLLMQKLTNIYTGDVNMQPSPPFQVFVQHIMETKESQAAAFWEEQFKGLEAQIFPALPKPDYQPVADVSTNYIIQGLQWPSTDVTASTVLRSAWSIAVAGYMDSNDILYGMTVTGRQIGLAGIEQIVGPTIATVPMRAMLDWDKTIEEIQLEQQAQAIHMAAFEQTGLQQIRRSSTDSQRACEFQTLLVIQPAAREEKNQETLFVSRHHVENKDKYTKAGAQFQSHPYALTVECMIQKHGVALRIGFDSHVIDKQRIEKLTANFENLLRVTCDPKNAHKKLREIETITQQDLQEIWKWNAAVPEASEVLVHDLIKQTVLNHPGAAAVCAWDGEWTYKELDDVSTRLAFHLVDLGVQPDVAVPLCFEKSRWTPVAMLAVMKAGGASVAMDVTQPEDRLRSVALQVKPLLLLTSSTNKELAARITDTPIVVVNDLTVSQLGNLNKKEEDPPVVKPWNKLYIVFTSGSTGTPKGAIITHSNFSTAIQHQGAAHGFEAELEPRLYDFASYAFDVAWSNILQLLVCGGCLCIPSEADRRDDLVGSMRRLRANFGYFTPSVAKLLPLESIKALKVLILGGENLTAEDAKRWSDMVTVKNVYGPCECTPVATIANINESTRHLPTIGNGVGVNTWIVRPSDHNYLVPIGDVGELLLDGPIVGAGYLNNAEKTAAAFIENPSWLLAQGRHGRLYKTGDLVRYNPDGSLAFVGRKDAQVKINGQRVELGDVEYHVRSNMSNDGDDIHVVAEVVNPSDGRGAVLLAFVHTRASINMPKEQLNVEMKRLATGLDDRLASQVPAYMIPTAYIMVKSIPMTATGKIDRRKLRALGEKMTLAELKALNAPAGDRREPETLIERHLQKLWSVVLDIEPSDIGADDSFLRIGGDSIAAMKLVAAARGQGLSLTVADIFTEPRLNKLAEKLISEQHVLDEEVPYTPFSLLQSAEDISSVREQVAGLCNVDEQIIEDVFPCTPLQEGLLALTAKSDGDYVARQAFELRATIDMSRFQKAWEEVVRTTPILRTRIVDLENQGLVQVVINQSTQWAVTAEITSRVMYEKADRQAVTGLGTPLVRVGLIEESGRRFFVWTAHHAIYDGWSVKVMLERLERAYSEELELQHLPLFQAFVRNILEVDDLRAATFWETQFDGLEAQAFPALPYPAYQPRTNESTASDIYGLTWPESDVTPSTAVRAAWSVVVSGSTDSNDVIFGVTLTGRQAAVPGIEQMMGPTIATVPVRVVLDQQKTVENIQLQVQGQAIEMTEFEQTGLQQIRRTGVKSQQACGFQTLLVIQPATTDKEDENGLFIKGHRDAAEDSRHGRFEFHTYAITIECKIEEHGLHLRAGFDSHLLSKHQVQKLLRQFEHVLQLMCRPENAQRKLVELETISDSDLRAVWKWNASVPEATEQCVHEIIEEKARMQPDSSAVCSWDGNWSYRELDDASTRLAHHLLSLGVGPDVIVPLCFEKSKWTPIALLAVMKTGAASVLIDTAQPEERLRNIVKQTSPILILSSSVNQELAGRLTQKPVVVTTVNDTELSKLARCNNIMLPIVNPRSKLYVVFTSGTTGTPKGVVITHANFSSAIRYQQKEHGFSNTSRVYDFVSYAFDIAWSNVIHSLTSGGCLCIPSESDRRDDLAGSIQRLQANTIQLTPSTASLLPSSTIRSLKTLILGGEAVSSEYAAQLAEMVDTKNAYGPSECTPATTLANVLPTKTYVGSIGSGLGTNLWVVRPSNHNYLVPVGDIGELVLEGPLVGDGYLNDPEKTVVAFIKDPDWLLRGAPEAGIRGRRGRLYKTGDLVRFDAEGNIIFIRRKDAQVKINGQRVELAEIESNIARLNPQSILQSACLLAESGPFMNKLVAIFSQKESQKNSSGSGESHIELASTHDAAQSQKRMEKLQASLEETLPAYMIPSIWIELKSLPLNTSGKMDRKKLQAWLDGMDFETHQKVSYSSQGLSVPREPQTPEERSIQAACSQILGISASKINLDRSFINNGGDSISAMRLSSHCRKIGTVFSVAAVLKSKSLAGLAQISATSTSTGLYQKEIFNKPFDLSPIQLWFFNQLFTSQANSSSYFNQGSSVKLNRSISPTDICDTISKLVKHHSMLRARFQQVNNNWKQQILAPADEHYHFGSSLVSSLGEIASRTAQMHQTLDIEKGPVFAADLYSLDGEQYLVLIAHHLVVDIVSWHILLADIHTLLNGGTLEPGLSFQAWNQLQIEEAKSVRMEPQIVLPKDSMKDIKDNLDFWQFTNNTSNFFAEYKKRSIEIDPTTTTLVLKEANNAFNTEPLDLILSAIWDAFFITFPEREDLTIFNEGHGREPWNEDVDLTRTVGWFTTASPIPLSRETSISANTVRFIKDSRRRLSANGWAYFASRYLNAKGIDRFKAHNATMEVAFNYSGQQLEQQDSLFTSVRLDGVSTVGGAVPSPALVNINASISKGVVRFAFSWNPYITHQDRMQMWIDQIGPSLAATCSDLCQKTASTTLCDYQFLDLNYAGLEELQNQIIPRIESLNDAVVDDIYPCSPMVDGILLSQIRDPSAYKTSHTFEISTAGESISLDRLAAAWQAVIARHAALRTVFIEGLDENTAFNQLVLKSYYGEVILLRSESESSALKDTKQLPPVQYGNNKPPHRLILCQTPSSTQIICRLEMSHAITDGSSISIIQSDWAKAYAGLSSQANDLLDISHDLARELRSTSTEEKMGFWRNKLAGVESCHFPRLNTFEGRKAGNQTSKASMSIPDDLFSQIQQLCDKESVTPATVFQTAWALTLAAYVGSDSVCFGYLAAGRDLPIQGITESVGAYANMLVCRANISRDRTGHQLLRYMHDQVVEDLDFQHYSLADIQHDLDIAPGKGLFNSIVSFQTGRDRQHGSCNTEEKQLIFHNISGEDPTEVSISTPNYRLSSINKSIV